MYGLSCEGDFFNLLKAYLRHTARVRILTRYICDVRASLHKAGQI